MEQNIMILYEEYKLASERIENYQNKHLNFLNISLILIGGGLSITYSNEKFLFLIKYIPYLVFLVLGVIFYHYKRTLVVQGHKKALEEIINNLLDENKKHLIFSELTFKNIINYKKNIFILVITFLVLLFSFYIIYFVNYSILKPKGFNYNFCIQSVFLMLLFFQFIYTTIKTANDTYNMALKLLKPKF